MAETTTPDNARNPTQRNIIQEFLDRGEDPFDKENVLQIYNEHGTYNSIVNENEEWYVMPNLWPLNNAKHHSVIVLKRNDVSDIKDLTVREIESLLEIQKWIIATYKIDAGAFCMRFGRSDRSGATVTHLHGHIISRIGDEPVSYYVGHKKSTLIPFSDDAKKAPVLDHHFFWELHGLSHDSRQLRIVHKDIPCDPSGPADISGEEWLDLLTLVKKTIETSPLLGGSLCITFGGMPLADLEGMQVHLLSPQDNEKFTFKI